MVLVIIIHVIICIALIGLVLIQRGRGSGLVESFQGVESMFGTKTNTFLTRTTTILSILFFLTCLSLAILSVRQSRSLMSDIKVQQPPAKQALPASEKQAPLAPEPNKQVTQELPKPQGEAAQKAQSAQELPKTE